MPRGMPPDVSRDGYPALLCADSPTCVSFAFLREGEGEKRTIRLPDPRKAGNRGQPAPPPAGPLQQEEGKAEAADPPNLTGIAGAVLGFRVHKPDQLRRGDVRLVFVSLQTQQWKEMWRALREFLSWPTGTNDGNSELPRLARSQVEEKSRRLKEWADEELRRFEAGLGPPGKGEDPAARVAQLSMHQADLQRQVAEKLVQLRSMVRAQCRPLKLTVGLKDQLGWLLEARERLLASGQWTVADVEDLLPLDLYRWVRRCALSGTEAHVHASDGIHLPLRAFHVQTIDVRIAAYVLDPCQPSSSDDPQVYQGRRQDRLFSSGLVGSGLLLHA